MSMADCTRQSLVQLECTHMNNPLKLYSIIRIMNNGAPPSCKFEKINCCEFSLLGLVDNKCFQEGRKLAL